MKTMLCVGNKNGWLLATPIPNQTQHHLTLPNLTIPRPTDSTVCENMIHQSGHFVKQGMVL